MLLILINISIQIQYLNQTMSVFDYLCGCFSRDAILDYLNSSKLNKQVIQQQKCMEDYDQKSESIYQQSKAKSYMFKQLPNQDLDERQTPKNQSSVANQQKRKRNRIFQPYSIDRSMLQQGQDYNQKCQGLGLGLGQDKLGMQQVELTVYSKISDPFMLLEIKLKMLKDLLNADINDDPNYSKIFDSQDENKIRIFSKGQINQKGKRLNVYQFKFVKIDKDCKSILQRFIKVKGEQRVGILEKQQLMRTEQRQTQKEGQKQKIDIIRRLFNKVLVVNQHQFILAQKTVKTQADQQQEESYTFISCSIQQSKGKKPKPGYLQGWSNLSGLQIKLIKEQQKEYLEFKGYLNVELDITVNPNMLKQPVIKELRHYIQNVICELEGSDAI